MWRFHHKLKNSMLFDTSESSFDMRIRSEVASSDCVSAACSRDAYPSVRLLRSTISSSMRRTLPKLRTGILGDSVLRFLPNAAAFLRKSSAWRSSRASRGPDASSARLHGPVLCRPPVGGKEDDCKEPNTCAPTQPLKNQTQEECKRHRACKGGGA